MPATTPEAIYRKEQNRKNKADIKREQKILDLGGTPIDCENKWLTKEERKARVEYYYDLMYPNRHENKESKGRPRKYETAEDRVAAQRQQAKDSYKKRKGEDPADYQYNPEVAAHMYTPWYNMYQRAKGRAKKENLPFSLEIDYLAKLFVETETCPLLNVEFSTYTEYARSLDKIIPSKGYTNENVQIISRKANIIKNNATFKEFETIYLNWKACQ